MLSNIFRDVIHFEMLEHKEQILKIFMLEDASNKVSQLISEYLNLYILLQKIYVIKGKVNYFERMYIRPKDLKHFGGSC